MTQAFGYTRLSGKGQEAGDGTDRQKLAIKKFAAANEIEIVDWFHDTQTGKDEWEDRKGWSAMVAAMNGVRTIVVEKMDRVARVLLVQELILRDLKKRDIKMLTSAGDDTDDDQPERIMFRQMLGVFAAYERTMLVLKLRGARQRVKARDGRCEGRKPYGMKNDEAQWLEYMRTLRKKGISFDGIADDMNKNGIVTRYGKRWIGATICQILERDK
jgi:DNA invertase Pin-like site-specific DNA recombinase